MTKVILKDIKKVYKDKIIFHSINMTAINGKTIAIKGKSGVGKSTLLNIIAGLEKPTSGIYYLNDIKMNEINLNRLSRVRVDRIGYISQHSPMIPGISAWENICVPLWFKKVDNIQKENETITETCKFFEVEHLLNEKIEKLSGGEIQRIGVIRSLINDPEIVVADEPTGALDDETAIKVLSCFHSLKSKGKIVIIATHSNMVADYCDEVYQLTREGLIPITPSL